MSRRKEPVGIWTSLVKKAIDASWKENSVPPSMRQIMDATGITSKSVVSGELRRLAIQGYIDIIDGKAVPRWVVDAIGK
jgi:SOS-response transcriptional repressor LexA